jgi:hypothetical protein
MNIAALEPMCGMACCWLPAKRTLVPPSFALIFMPRLHKQERCMSTSMLNHAPGLSACANKQWLVLPGSPTHNKC